MRNKNLFSYILIFLSLLLSKLWLLDQNNFFIFDDFSHLLTVQQSSYLDLIKIWPQQMYNDRPLGLIFIKLLYSLFHDKFIYYQITIILVHLLNSFLLFNFSKKLLQNLKVKNYCTISLVATLFFAAWPRSTFAVQWLSAIFDLLSVTLSLAFFHLFQNSKLNPKAKVVLLCLVFFMTLRTKESTLFIPLIALLFSSQKERKILLAPIVLMAAYFVTIINLALTSNFQNFDINNPYYPSLNPFDWISSTLHYFYLYFNLRESGIDFVSYSITGITSLTSFIILILLTLKKNLKKYSHLFLSALLCLAPLLPLINRQQKLYLYLPSIFLSILVSLALYNLLSKLNLAKALLPLVIIVLVFVNYIEPLYTSEKSWWLSTNRVNKNTYSDLSKHPLESDSILICNISNPDNIFIYGPGNALKLYHHNSKLTVTLSQDPCPTNTYFINYQNLLY